MWIANRRARAKRRQRRPDQRDGSECGGTPPRFETCGPVVHEAGGRMGDLQRKRETGNVALTLARLVPSFLLPLPLALVGCIDREEPMERGATGRLVPTPTAGDMERGGTAGGGPGSPPGDRRCELRDGFIIRYFVPLSSGGGFAPCASRSSSTSSPLLCFGCLLMPDLGNGRCA